MNRPYLFSSDLVARRGKLPFSEKQTIKEARKQLLNNTNTNIFFFDKEKIFMDE